MDNNCLRLEIQRNRRYRCTLRRKTGFKRCKTLSAIGYKKTTAKQNTHGLVILGIGPFARFDCRKFILWVRLGFIPIGGRGERGDF